MLKSLFLAWLDEDVELRQEDDVLDTWFSPGSAEMGLAMRVHAPVHPLLVQNRSQRSVRTVELGFRGYVRHLSSHRAAPPPPPRPNQGKRARGVSDRSFKASKPCKNKQNWRSGLWPFATVGWPDESSGDYAKYYPDPALENAHMRRHSQYEVASAFEVAVVGARVL